ncbi:MAG: four helix bundle protein [Planctomycetes bacterium]|nr:four helix bundle protein [Planctomycetota bacterium]
MKLATHVYKLTQTWPKSETYGLTSQVRRAAVSVPANIAEGHHRGSTAEFLQFLRISRGSLSELRTLIRIAANVEYVQEQELQELFGQLSLCMKLLAGLIRALERKKSSRDE